MSNVWGGIQQTCKELKICVGIQRLVNNPAENYSIARYALTDAPSAHLVSAGMAAVPY